jgi:hypothetical protein
MHDTADKLFFRTHVKPFKDDASWQGAEQANDFIG